VIEKNTRSGFLLAARMTIRRGFVIRAVTGAGQYNKHQGRTPEDLQHKTFNVSRNEYSLNSFFVTNEFLIRDLYNTSFCYASIELD